MRLPQGRVVIALASAFAPRHVANIKALARAGFYDGLSMVRVQDNYVVQWGDAGSSRPTGSGHLRLAPEFEHAYASGEGFTALPDADSYAPLTGFSGSFPTARDPALGKSWLVHCYGMVGAGRDTDPGTGGGAELYAVIGQAPRQLDRNVTLVGRVLQGMDILAALPRGHGEIGLYQRPPERIPILSLRVGSDMPVSDRIAVDVLRTDSPTFAKVVENRRFRREPWFQRAAGRIDVCNLPIPQRVRPAA
jgi:peptidylprolyl isomerase